MTVWDEVRDLIFCGRVARPAGVCAVRHRSRISR